MVRASRWRRPRYWLWLAVLLLLAWLLQTISPVEVWRVLGRLSLGPVLLLLAANGLALLSMSGRWWLILRAQGYRLPYLALAGYRLAAFGVSYFTPGPQFGGEPVQVYLVQRHQRVPGSSAVAAVTLDKLLELLVNFGFLVGGLLLALQQQIFAASLAWLLTGLGLALLAVPLVALLSLSAGGAPFSAALRLTDRLALKLAGEQLLSRVALYRQVTALARASEQQATDFCRRQPGALLLALVVSMVTWALLMAEYWLTLYFLGATLTPAQTIIALTSARVAILLPLPGGLGSLEASQVLALQVLGFEPAIGLSSGLLIRARDVLLGGVGLWWGGLKV